MDRRKFLKWMGAVGIGFSPLVFAAPLGNRIFGRGLASAGQTRPLMGTLVAVTVLHPSQDKAIEAMEDAFGEIERLIPLLDRHRADTPLSHLNRTGTLRDIPAELHEVMEQAERFHRLTGGVFDVTVKPVLDLFEDHFSLEKTFPPAEKIRKALSRVGAQKVIRQQKEIRFSGEGMGISLDGIAKGYIVDRAVSRLRKGGIRHALINAGGDISALGDKGSNRPWRIAVQDPRDKGRVVDIVPLQEGALATSGDYENFFDTGKKFHHIINPQTGLSPHQFASVSVRASSLAEADALATAAFIPSRDKAKEWIRALPGVEALWIDRNQEAVASGGWKS